MMRDDFCRLDRAGWQPSGRLSGRGFGSFDDGVTLASLDQHTTLEELGISDEDCRCRRQVYYGRGDPDGI